MPVRLIGTPRFGDERGWFAETFNARRLAGEGVTVPFVQDNHSYSREAGTVRGLHFQRPPSAQAKLVRVGRGRILDVAVDVRRGSPTYGRWVGAELSAEAENQLFVPEGFAHGFGTLEAHTEVLYKVSAFYDAEADTGLIWNDPDLAIPWPVSAEKAIVSRKDGELPRFEAFESPFSFDGVPLTPVPGGIGTV
jgi:dTDP-4-dehydrorhamnose 3,5-epimerase